MSGVVIARARVAVTLEMDLSAPWGGDCNLEQVFKQAKESAEEDVRLKFQKIGGVRLLSTKVTAILCEEKR